MSACVQLRSVTPGAAVWVESEGEGEDEGEGEGEGWG